MKSVVLFILNDLSPYLKAFLITNLLMLMVMILTLLERKISAWIQDRHGPNRVGPGGLLQPIADGIKHFIKEDVIPGHVDKFLYILAPIVAMIPALVTFAVVPFGDQMTIPIYGEPVTFKFQVADISVGILYVISISSLAVYGLIIGGYGSNNKYSMLGGLRSSAQMISYELPMGLAIVGVVMLCGSLRLNDIVVDQSHFLNWNIFRQPLGFVIFVIAIFAETNRLPFDLPEAEQELVGGYHTEYSSMKFSAFMIGEYVHMTTASALITTLYLGGWQIPGLESLGLPIIAEQILQILSFCAKTMFFLFVFIWVRWSLPRFRYDQLMNLGWRKMLPLGLLNVIVTAAFVAFV